MRISSQDSERSQLSPCPVVGSHTFSVSKVLLFETLLQGLNIKVIKAVDYNSSKESGVSFSSNTEPDYSRENGNIPTVTLSVPQTFLSRFLLQVLSRNLHPSQFLSPSPTCKITTWISRFCFRQSLLLPSFLLAFLIPPIRKCKTMAL